MKKVLFVASISGHIKAFHIPCLKLFKDMGWTTSVAAKSSINHISQSDYCDNFYEIPIERSPFSYKNILAIYRLKKIIESEKFDIIHCHTPLGGVVARIAAKNARKKYGTRVIYTAHGFHFFKGAPLLNWVLFYPIEKYLAKYTDTLICINQEDYNRAKLFFSRRCKNIEYVPGVGINTKRFNVKIKEKDIIKMKKSFGIGNNDYVLTCVARLDYNKNQG